jgi:hypothetical protein
MRGKIMSEEQPVFKVTDRRLFNPDGTPRETERKEEAETEKAAAHTKTPEPATAGAKAEEPMQATAQAAPAAAATAPASTPAQTAPAASLEEPVAEDAAGLSEDDYAESQIPGVDDPASFINFLMSIASNAAAALGMMEHPVTGERRVDPELARHWIDVLGMLEQKTRGNLDPQEKQIFEGLLADLRMQYVSVSGMRQPKAPRGFTGNDITGGR